MAQEVFITAYRKQAQFRQDEDFGKWLRGIARRKVMGERTKSARRYRIMHDGITDILLSLGIEKQQPEPARDRMVEIMNSCVDKLNDSQQELLRCRYEEGRQAKDLASQMHVTAVAVRKQLQRIRTAVRNCMEARLKEVA